MNHRINAMERRLKVYTFSFTTDWFHTVNAVAAHSAPARAASRRGHVAGTMLRRNRSPIRNQQPAATAPGNAAERIMGTPGFAAHGVIPPASAHSREYAVPA